MEVRETVVDAVLRTLEQYGAVSTPLHSPARVRRRVHTLVDWIVGDQSADDEFERHGHDDLPAPQAPAKPENT
jgi:hypothetical protein